MFERHCTRSGSVLTASSLAACLLVGGLAAGTAEAQSVLEGYSVTLNHFGGDGTLPTNLGFICFWDDGIWTMTDYIDVGYFVLVGNKTYLIGGVEGEEHLSMVFKRRRGDLILGAPANATELPGQDVLIVASAKWRRRDLGCTSRAARTARTLLSTATLGATRALRPER